MNYKPLTLLAVLCAGFCFTVPAPAQGTFNFQNIDTLLEDHALDEAANRYVSILLSFFPEEATRLGYTSANNRLDARTPQQFHQAFAALKSIENELSVINTKQLSDAKRVEKLLLENSLQNTIFSVTQNRLENDPLYYAQAIDSIYDVLLKHTSTPLRRRSDATQRMQALSSVYTQAEKQLIAPPPFLAQLAMEKTYYAYLSFDDVIFSILEGDVDEDTSFQIKRAGIMAKAEIKKLFELFKRLSQEQTNADFRLGTPLYMDLLATRYQIAEKPVKLTKQLKTDVDTAQRALTLALEPYNPEPDMDEETVVDEETGETITRKVPHKQVKKNKKDMPLRNGQDFYAAFQKIIEANPPATSDPVTAFQQDAPALLRWLVEQGVLPAKNVLFNIMPMPKFYAYTQAYKFVPPFGDILEASYLIRQPEGNTLTQTQQRNEFFNNSVRKLRLSEDLVPGHYYQALVQPNLPFVRRLFPSKSLQNGWIAYIQQRMQQVGYLTGPEDELFIAWENFLRALTAWTDFNIHTRAWSYTSALEELTQTYGLKQEAAEQILKQVAANPAQALAYREGLQAYQTAYQKFSKKQGKKFSEADFNAKLLKIGFVPPAQLEKELTKLYQQDKQPKLF